MKLLIIHYVRRWWYVLLVVALASIWIPIGVIHFALPMMIILNLTVAIVGRPLFMTLPLPRRKVGLAIWTLCVPLYFAVAIVPGFFSAWASIHKRQTPNNITQWSAISEWEWLGFGFSALIGLGLCSLCFLVMSWGGRRYAQRGKATQSVVDILPIILMSFTAMLPGHFPERLAEVQLIHYALVLFVAALCVWSFRESLQMFVGNKECAGGNPVRQKKYSLSRKPQGAPLWVMTQGIMVGGLFALFWVYLLLRRVNVPKDVIMPLTYLTGVAVMQVVLTNFRTFRVLPRSTTQLTLIILTPGIVTALIGSASLFVWSNNLPDTVEDLYRFAACAIAVAGFFGFSLGLCLSLMKVGYAVVLFAMIIPAFFGAPILKYAPQHPWLPWTGLGLIGWAFFMVKRALGQSSLYRFRVPSGWNQSS